MGANPDSDEFDEDEADEIAPEEEELDLARAIKDMDIAKRRGEKVGEPAWRRLEQRLEQRRTAELISDFEDYDVDDSAQASSSRGDGKGRPRK
ncbi:MAG TPA: hypothetical protein VN660_04445 [Steroidobacteraceae bacterium]|nr:hypothetical protein [Steroidobacteraceae bacterium]